MIPRKAVHLDAASRVVELDDGERLSAGVVVVATGAWTKDLLGVPTRPVKGQLVHLRARGTVTLTAGNIRGLDCYILTRADGRVVLGATVEERGFEPEVTSGAVHDLLADAYELVPGLLELEFVGATVGFRPGTPDNSPVIGEVAPGVIVAAGHYRNGILLAPVTAEAIVALAGGIVPPIVQPFLPARFERARGLVR